MRNRDKPAALGATRVQPFSRALDELQQRFAAMRRGGGLGKPSLKAGFVLRGNIGQRQPAPASDVPISEMRVGNDRNSRIESERLRSLQTTSRRRTPDGGGPLQPRAETGGFFFLPVQERLAGGKGSRSGGEGRPGADQCETRGQNRLLLCGPKCLRTSDTPEFPSLDTVLPHAS